MRSFAAIAAGSVLLALVGCKGPTHRQVDASEPGLIDVDNIGLNEVRQATEAMLTKVSKLNLEGWANHIILTEDSPKRPQVRIAGVQNRTNEQFDVVMLENELLNALVNQEVVYVVGGASDLAAVNAERDYSQAGMTNEEIPYGQEDRVALVLVGEITEDVIDQRNVRQHDFVFGLRLVDTVKNRVMAVTSTKIRKVRED